VSDEEDGESLCRCELLRLFSLCLEFLWRVVFSRSLEVLVVVVLFEDDRSFNVLVEVSVEVDLFLDVLVEISVDVDLVDVFVLSFKVLVEVSLVVDDF